MSLDLLNELEKRVQSAVSTIEDLKLEIEQLKEENTALVSEKDAWEGRLAELLGKFDLIDSTAPDTAEEVSEFTAENDTEENLEDETLANQAFEQDFSEATEESEQGNGFSSNNNY
ncbi:cell division protein ZapB [Oceanospirillum sp.]|uniref:cell division protein ZapB n=1 Tax=Oceanospirillum sp. TaxID=2021254 RepID=UPI003A945B07